MSRMRPADETIRRSVRSCASSVRCRSSSCAPVMIAFSGLRRSWPRIPTNISFMRRLLASSILCWWSWKNDVGLAA